MRIDVFSIFPEMVDHIADQSVIGRGRRDGHLDIQCTTCVRPRPTFLTRRRCPLRRGAGMVMMPEPLFDAVEAVEPPRPLFYLSPSGRRFDQSMAHELAELDGFSLLCGHFEGVDERVREHLCDGEISVGDVVLAGGEVAAAMIIGAVQSSRAGWPTSCATSVEDESFADGLLEYPLPVGGVPRVGEPTSCGPAITARSLSAPRPGDRTHGAQPPRPSRRPWRAQRRRAAALDEFGIVFPSAEFETLEKSDPNRPCRRR